MKNWGTPWKNALIFSAAREQLPKKQRGLLAPRRAIDAVEAATNCHSKKAAKPNNSFFIECLFSEQSKSLIHVFSSASVKWPRFQTFQNKTNIIPIQSAAVVGGGLPWAAASRWCWPMLAFPSFLKRRTQSRAQIGGWPPSSRITRIP